MKTLTTLLCLAAIAIATEAGAQQQTHLTLPTGGPSTRLGAGPSTALAAGHWDAAGQVGLLNRNRPELSRWDHWYSAAAVDASAGRYWTPHFKTEFEIGTATKGSIDGEESTPVPGLSYPFPRYRDHTLRETTVGATALYQFFDNQWVHPFVGGGAELVRERHAAGAVPAETIRVPTTVPGITLPALPAIDTVNYSVRPLVTGGFKFYVSPHAFVRTEVRTAFSTSRPVAVQWRGGIGFDF
jgi:hypothetical protein